MTDAHASIAGARGVGLATFAADGRVLDTWYPSPALASSADAAAEAGRLGAEAPGSVRLDATTASDL
ncbi:MAG TPA: hypothetical protein VKD21_12150, partial [Acidimicrobiales bacterium]|nr:hypothetical protein [Acidimicrobiales bacterium]